MGAIIILYLAIVILMIAGWWGIFSKAGQPGWAAIIPIYNIYIMTQVAKKPGWWVAMILLVPVANIIFLIMTWHNIALNYGKTAGFTVGMIFLSFIFIPILGLGSAKYIGNQQPQQPA